MNLTPIPQLVNNVTPPLFLNDNTLQPSRNANRKRLLNTTITEGTAAKLSVERSSSLLIKSSRKTTENEIQTNRGTKIKQIMYSPHSGKHEIFIRNSNIPRIPHRPGTQNRHFGLNGYNEAD